MNLAALVTGGKDSILALYKAQKKNYNIKVLATMIPKRSDSYMFHFPNIHMGDYISKALEIPIVKAKTSGVKEKELDDLKQLLASIDIDGVITGAIASSYQKERIDRLCNELDIKSIAPLWHNDPLKIMKELISLKFKVILVAVSAYGLNKSWLGNELTPNALEKLVKLNRDFQLSLVGEGGEYESLVLDCPIFKKRIKIIEAKTEYENFRGVYLIKSAKLVNK